MDFVAIQFEIITFVDVLLNLLYIISSDYSCGIIDWKIKIFQKGL